MNQKIYLYAISLSFLKKSKRAKTYTKTRIGTKQMPIVVLSRAEEAVDIQSHKPTLFRIISEKNIIGQMKSFKVEEVYSKKYISDSFYYKAEDYNQEFKSTTNVEFT